MQGALTGMELPARATAHASCSHRALAPARRPAAAPRRHCSPAPRASSRQPELWTPDQDLLQVRCLPACPARALQLTWPPSLPSQTAALSQACLQELEEPGLEELDVPSAYQGLSREQIGLMGLQPGLAKLGKQPDPVRQAQRLPARALASEQLSRPCAGLPVGQQLLRRHVPPGRLRRLCDQGQRAGDAHGSPRLGLRQAVQAARPAVQAAGRPHRVHWHAGARTQASSLPVAAYTPLCPACPPGAPQGRLCWPPSHPPLPCPLCKQASRRSSLQPSLMPGARVRHSSRGRRPGPLEHSDLLWQKVGGQGSVHWVVACAGCAVGAYRGTGQPAARCGGPPHGRVPLTAGVLPQFTPKVTELVLAELFFLSIDRANQPINVYVHSFGTQTPNKQVGPSPCCVVTGLSTAYAGAAGPCAPGAQLGWPGAAPAAR